MKDNTFFAFKFPKDNSIEKNIKILWMWLFSASEIYSVII